MVIQRRRTSGLSIAQLENTDQISMSPASSEGSSSGSWTRQRGQEGLLRTINSRINQTQDGDRGSGCDFDSLDLLRENLQLFFDEEVARVVESYRETYFEKALENLKENLGEHLVSKDVLPSVLCKMVHESAKQFSSSNSERTLSRKMSLCSTNPSPLFDTSDSESSQDGDVTTVDAVADPQSTTTALPVFNATFQKFSPFPSWSSAASSCEQVVAKRKLPVPGTEDDEGDCPTITTDSEAASSKSLLNLTSFDILHSTLTRPSTCSTSSNSQVTWNSPAVAKDTLFVLETQARKLFPEVEFLGRHQELIRYPPDNDEDLNWLCNERLLPANQRSNIGVQLLVRDEVVRLKSSLDPGWNSIGFMGFKVPEFMFRKMQKYFSELSIRNQRIRTSSGYFDTVLTTIKRESSDEETPLSKKVARNASGSNLSSSHATLTALLGIKTEVQEN